MRGRRLDASVPPPCTRARARRTRHGVPTAVLVIALASSSCLVQDPYREIGGTTGGAGSGSGGTGAGGTGSGGTGGSTCLPKTCAELGCGKQSNGCGDILDCGGCTGGTTGGGGTGGSSGGGGAGGSGSGGASSGGGVGGTSSGGGAGGTIGGGGAGGAGGSGSGGAETVVTWPASGAIVVDDTAVYWTQDHKEIKRADKNGVDAGVKTLQTMQSFTRFLAVDQNRVYWSRASGGIHVSSYPKAGTGALLSLGFSSYASESALALGGGQVYWTDGVGGVLASPTGGGTQRTLRASTGTMSFQYAVGVVGSEVVTTDSNPWRLIRTTDNGACDAIGGTPCVSTTLVTLGAQPYALTSASSGHVYYSYFIAGTMNMRLARVAVSGGSEEILAAPVATKNWLAVDTTHVYWVDELAKEVQRVPLAGGPVQTVCSTASSAEGAIALDSTHVYFASGGIKRVAKPQ